MIRSEVTVHLLTELCSLYVILFFVHIRNINIMRTYITSVRGHELSERVRAHAYSYNYYLFIYNFLILLNISYTVVNVDGWSKSKQ